MILQCFTSLDGLGCAVQLCSVSKFAKKNVDISGDLFNGTKDAADRFVTPF